MQPPAQADLSDQFTYFEYILSIYNIPIKIFLIYQNRLFTAKVFWLNQCSLHAKTDLSDKFTYFELIFSIWSRFEFIWSKFIIYNSSKVFWLDQCSGQNWPF